MPIWFRGTVLGAIVAPALAIGCATEITRPEGPLTVTAVSPTLGTLAGNVALDITGTSFSDVVRVTVGDTDAPYFIVRSSTHITALLPVAAAPGAVDVVVTSQRHGAATCTACFHYYDPHWTVTGVSPDTGSLEGGMRVTISGTGFGEVAGAMIGGAALDSVKVVSPTEITAVTPAQGEPGVRDVVVTSAHAGARTCQRCFAYQLEVVAQPVAAGGFHSCALSPAGTAYCWGHDGNGELGDDSPLASSDTPVRVAGRHVFRFLTSMHYHTCGLLPSGVALCWGLNTAGRLGGNATERAAPVPIEVLGGLTFSAMSAGSDHTCGLTRTGSAYCWGWNANGQLGIPAGRHQTIPHPVTGGHTFTTIAAGHAHTCALTASGAAYCWGRAEQLGTGGADDTPTPTLVAGGLTFRILDAGQFHTCGITASGAAYCWGAGYFGQLGNGSQAEAPTPTPVSGGLTFLSITAGENHTCGLDGAGMAYCWGWNTAGQLGDGTTSTRSVPGPVAGTLMFSTLSAGWQHTCGNTQGGAAYCWGRNSSGQLGNGTTDSSLVPVPVLPFGASPAR